MGRQALVVYDLTDIFGLTFYRKRPYFDLTFYKKELFFGLTFYRKVFVFAQNILITNRKQTKPTYKVRNNETSKLYP